MKHIYIILSVSTHFLARETLSLCRERERDMPHEPITKFYRDVPATTKIVYVSRVCIFIAKPLRSVGLPTLARAVTETGAHRVLFFGIFYYMDIEAFLTGKEIIYLCAIEYLTLQYLFLRKCTTFGLVVSTQDYCLYL